MAKSARSPQKFFSSGTAAEANLAALKKERQKSYARSSPAKKPSKRLPEPSDSDSDTAVATAKPATVKRPKKVKVAVKAAARPPGSTAPKKSAKAIVADVGADSDEERFALPWNYLDATAAERRRFMRDLDQEIKRDQQRAKEGSGSVDLRDAGGSGLAK